MTMTNSLCEVQPVATYVLPDNRLTDKQRKHYLIEGVPDDTIEIAWHVMENFPAVYDDAVEATARANRLAQIRAMKEDSE